MPTYWYFRRMQNILLIGAGRSSSHLIKYLLDHASSEQWTLTIADISIEEALKKAGRHTSARAISLDILDTAALEKTISVCDLVISLLPAHMHISVAVECVKQKKNLLTASYVSDEMQKLDKDAIAAGIILLNECGLDPGIDHMSAMKIIDHIKNEKGVLNSFRSYTGGLVAPESNDNPWGYKFSWNPRNVILAGQGTAKYIEDGEYRYIPYNRVFSEVEKIQIDNAGSFDGYANRDSLSYRHHYGIENIPTMIRGTLRYEGFCAAWNIIVNLGLTDDTYKVENSESLTYAELMNAYLPGNKSTSIKVRLANFAGLSTDSNQIQMVEWTGLLDNRKIGIKNASPAQILENLLKPKWLLRKEDKDMIVMQHQFGYEINGTSFSHISSLVVKGDDDSFTAMAKTVGLPLAITAKHILKKRITLKGVKIPVHAEIYNPVLKELEIYGVSFVEKHSEPA
jgi:saccharopine dehydrogenase-like NADP-dependent oxidoreductase